MLLVTGGTGFIGGHLLERLCASGVPVKCLVRPTVPARRLPNAVQAVPGDLISGQGLAEAVDGVETIFHLAGVTKALWAADYFAGNARATANLAGALAGRSVRFVHVSSLAAAGPSPNGSPVAEDAEPRPVTNYGRSKLESERIVRDRLPGAVIVRPAVVYGPRDTDVFQILKSISKGLVVEISGGERWFSAIYVEDLVDGLLAAAGSSVAAGRVYFLANPKPVSWTELGLAAARIMGRKPHFVRVPPAVAYAAGCLGEIWSHIRRRPGIISREKVIEARCPNWTCDTRRAAAELAFSAKTTLPEGLAFTLAWYKEAGWLTY